MYLSTEGHVSLRKAARLLGVPPDHIRLIGVDQRRRMRVDNLAARMRADRDLGLVPSAVLMSGHEGHPGRFNAASGSRLTLPTRCHR